MDANILKDEKSTHVRPSWDEYFMEITQSVAKRATCDRGRSGCVIVKGKQILVSGYVGSPKGMPHCDEVGHQMKTMRHEDGSETKHCVRTTHAEQNAIAQAAKLGVAIDGANVQGGRDKFGLLRRISRNICQPKIGIVSSP